MNTNVEKIQAELKVLADKFNVLKEGIDKAEDWNSLGEIVSNIKDIGKFLQDVVIAVELVCLDALQDVEDIKGSDKREAAALYLDEVIKFKGWSKPIELVDEKIFSIVLSLTVYFINQKYGNDWNVDSIRDALTTGSSYVTDIDLDAV